MNYVRMYICMYALDLGLHLLHYSGLGESGLFRSNTHVRLMLYSVNIYLKTARVSVALLRRFVLNLMHTHSSFVGFIAKSHQAR
jgi:hypothetical protein